MKRLKFVVLLIFNIHLQVSQGCERKEIIKSRPAHCLSRHRGKCYQSQLREDHLWTKLEQENFRFKPDPNTDDEYDEDDNQGSRQRNLENQSGREMLGYHTVKKDATLYIH